MQESGLVTTTVTGQSAPGSARVLMKDRAYEYIKKLILDGTCPPGTFLSERDLCETLDMSKTPIRAALERLAEQDFVTIAPQRGVIVRDFAPREVSDHYDLRIALEMFIMREIGGALTLEQQAEVEENLARQRDQVHGDVDIEGWQQSDAEFHLMLARFLGNSQIEWVMARQRDKLRRVVEQIAFRDPKIPPLSYAEHAGIYEALKEGNRELAMSRVEEHLTNGKRFLLMGGRYGG